jgi:hypothetical protein
VRLGASEGSYSSARFSHGVNTAPNVCGQRVIPPAISTVLGKTGDAADSRTEWSE